MASRAEATEVAATRAVLVMVVHRSPKRSACTELCACASSAESVTQHTVRELPPKAPRSSMVSRLSWKGTCARPSDSALMTWLGLGVGVGVGLALGCASP